MHAIKILNLLNVNNIKKANKDCTIIQIKAFNIVTCPDGIGRFFVLSTLASYFLSKISFQVHPAPRIKNAPSPHAINNHIS